MGTTARTLLGLTIAVAAILRFAQLSDQSLWFDEALTLGYTRESYGGMLSTYPDLDANPPLYYSLVWLWARIFGDSDVGLRSLSAVVGVLTVPVAYTAARELLGRRAGLAAAVLVAISPAMIWYSIEARPYALAILLSALAFTFFARALGGGGSRALAGWAICAALALATHYFSAFVVGTQAVWLLARVQPRRPVAVAVAAVALAGAALLPLALYQREHAGPEWISELPLRGRVEAALHFFLAGTADVPTRTALVGGLAVLAIAGLVLHRGDPTARRGFLTAAGVGVGAIGVTLIASLAGADYVLDRNLLPAAAPLVIAVAGAAALRRAEIPALLALLVLCAIFVRYDAKLATEADLQRDDWESVARALGPADRSRVVVVGPGWQSLALRVYMPNLEVMAGAPAVTEVNTLIYSRPGWGRDAPPQPSPGPAFRLTRRVVVQRITLTEFRATRPTRVAPSALATHGPNGSWVFVEGRD